jgi:hypothetical protein
MTGDDRMPDPTRWTLFGDEAADWISRLEHAVDVLAARVRHNRDNCCNREARPAGCDSCREDDYVLEAVANDLGREVR